MHECWGNRCATLRIGVQSEQCLARGGDKGRTATDIKYAAARVNRHMQALFDLAKIGVERSAQIGQ